MARSERRRPRVRSPEGVRNAPTPFWRNGETAKRTNLGNLNGINDSARGGCGPDLEGDIRGTNPPRASRLGSIDPLPARLSRPDGCAHLGRTKPGSLIESMIWLYHTLRLRQLRGQAARAATSTRASRAGRGPGVPLSRASVTAAMRPGSFGKTISGENNNEINFPVMTPRCRFTSTP